MPPPAKSPPPKSVEEQTQESLKRLGLFAFAAMIVLSLFASCLGKKHRAESVQDIPVSVPAEEAPAAEAAAEEESVDPTPLPPPPLPDAGAGPEAGEALSPGAGTGGPPPMGPVQGDGTTRSGVSFPGVPNPPSQ